jgi:hypothetical protein
LFINQISSISLVTTQSIHYRVGEKGRINKKKREKEKRCRKKMKKKEEGKGIKALKAL